MPRQKEYDREHVLQKAMQVFWRKGYEATSMQDLVEATQLNRYSMYEAFKSKEGLFLEVLDKYRDEAIAQVLAPLNEEPKGLQSIRKMFDGLLAFQAQAQDVSGCLMTCAAVDLPVLTKGAKDRVERHMQRLEEAFVGCLQAAKANGELAPEADVRALGIYLNGIMQAFGVLGRVYTGDVQHTKTFVEVALGNLSGAQRLTAQRPQAR